MWQKTDFKYFGALIADEARLPPGADDHGRPGPAVERLMTSSPLAVRVKASDRDRCVKSKPKRRQTIGTMKMSDGMSWSEHSYDVETVVEMYDGHFPIIVKVVDAGNTQTSENLCTGQVFLIQGSGQQRRAVAGLADEGVLAMTSPLVTTATKETISIPVDYVMDVDISQQDTHEIQLLPLAKVLQTSQFPVVVRVENVSEVDAAVFSNNQKLQLIGFHQLIFLRASAMVNGWVEQFQVVVIPGCVGTRLLIANGLSSSSEKAHWEDYLNTLFRSVRHQISTSNTVSGYHGLLNITEALVEGDIQVQVPSGRRAKPIAIYENVLLNSSTSKVFDDHTTIDSPSPATSDPQDFNHQTLSAKYDNSSTSNSTGLGTQRQSAGVLGGSKTSNVIENMAWCDTLEPQRPSTSHAANVDNDIIAAALDVGGCSKIQLGGKIIIWRHRRS